MNDLDILIITHTNLIDETSRLSLYFPIFLTFLVHFIRAPTLSLYYGAFSLKFHSLIIRECLRIFTLAERTFSSFAYGYCHQRSEPLEFAYFLGTRKWAVGHKGHCFMLIGARRGRENVHCGSHRVSSSFMLSIWRSGLFEGLRSPNSHFSYFLSKYFDTSVSTKIF